MGKLKMINNTIQKERLRLIRHYGIYSLMICAFSLLPSGLFATPFEIDDLEKHQLQFTVEWKTYTLPQNERISLYGAKRRHFISPNIYWGEAGYGALTGRRSGYLEGGLIVGYQGHIASMIYEYRLFTGAGGGGSAPQGGGFIVNPTMGLGIPLTKDIHATIELGYIKFLNGDIESYTLGTNITWSFWELSPKPKHKETHNE